MFGTLLGVALIFGASLAVGQAILALTWRREWSWLAPAVGLAALIVLTGAAVRLPGRAIPAAIVLVLAFVAALVVIVRARLVRAPTLRAAGAVAAAFALAMLPFLANGRFGLLGVSFNNDTAIHLMWAEGLTDDVVSSQFTSPGGYPLGPHSLVAAVTQLTTIELDSLFNALLIAGGLAAALAAQSFLRRSLAVAGVVVGALVAFPYLVAGYYGQGSFKELLQPLFLIAFIGLLRQIADDPPRTRRAIALAGVGPGLVAAATVWNYSHVGVVWIVGAVVLWALLELAADAIAGRRLRVPGAVRALGPVVVAAAVVGLAAILPDVDRILDYAGGVGADPAGSGAIKTSDLGNLIGPLSAYEGLGLWSSADYRVPPGHQFHAGQLAGIALVVGAFAALRSLARREFAVLAMVGVSALIYYRSKTGQSPYVSAKALAILSPPFLLMCGQALVEPHDRSWRPRFDATALRYAAAAVFLGLAVWSSWNVLRASFVGSKSQEEQLGEFAGRTAGTRTLVLVPNDYASWALRPTRVAHPPTGPPSPIPFQTRPEKPWTYGEPLDFDSMTPQYLDSFSYVVTSRTGFRSEPPPNFRVVDETGLYTLWQRRGPTPERQTIETGGAPGAVLDCRKRPGRRLSRAPGTARVRAAPIQTAALPALGPGKETATELTLPPGEWELSAQYVSPRDLTYSAGEQSWKMPAKLDRPGAYFRLGRVQSDGTPLRITISADEGGPISSPTHAASPGIVAATSVAPPRDVPLRKACGRYVDWYRTG